MARTHRPLASPGEVDTRSPSGNAGKYKHKTGTPRGVHTACKGVTAIALAAILLINSTGAAKSPDPEIKVNIATLSSAPSLTRTGEDLIITGSVAGLFGGHAFSGPNRAAKSARKRPAEDGLTISTGFEEARLRLAALRDDALIPMPGMQSDFASAEPVEEEGPRMSIAAIDPKLTSAALSAIAAVDGSDDDLGQPLPISIPERLAYARANTPVTEFKTPVSRKVSDKQLSCLATAIYFEARGESYRGQVAVAQVVMNRVNHKLYPNTICGVVYQNQSRRNACQFSFACDGIPERVNDKKSWAQAEEIAEKVTNGSIYLTEVANATHYHATYVSPRWAPRMTRVTAIGLHRFYRFKNS